MAVADASQNNKGTSQVALIPPLTIEEEDHIILARITNDERPLRRVIKKFHNYASLAYPPVVPALPVNTSNSVDDARESFLVELASFKLSLKKSAMICGAETRQVEEYKKERQRIDEEHETLRTQIEELKTALEHAQMLRRRKIEYDMVTEKVNTLPSREELEQSICALENDMTAIRDEHETQNRIIQSQKSALDSIIVDLSSLRFMGKEKDLTSAANSNRATPTLEGTETTTADGNLEISTDAGNSTMSTQDEKEEGEEDKNGFESEGETGIDESTVEDDIEMGEVEENPRDKIKKKQREDLEEGEASDASSELSEPPDD